MSSNDHDLFFVNWQEYGQKKCPVFIRVGEKPECHGWKASTSNDCWKLVQVVESKFPSPKASVCWQTLEYEWPDPGSEKVRKGEVNPFEAKVYRLSMGFSPLTSSSDGKRSVELVRNGFGEWGIYAEHLIDDGWMIHQATFQRLRRSDVVLFKNPISAFKTPTLEPQQVDYCRHNGGRGRQFESSSEVPHEQTRASRRLG
eukprot:g20181.t1